MQELATIANKKPITDEAYVDVDGVQRHALNSNSKPIATIEVGVPTAGAGSLNLRLLTNTMILRIPRYWIVGLLGCAHPPYQGTANESKLGLHMDKDCRILSARNAMKRMALAL